MDQPEAQIQSKQDFLSHVYILLWYKTLNIKKILMEHHRLQCSLKQEVSINRKESLLLTICIKTKENQNKAICTWKIQTILVDMWICKHWTCFHLIHIWMENRFKHTTIFVKHLRQLSCGGRLRMQVFHRENRKFDSVHSLPETLLKKTRKNRINPAKLKVDKLVPNQVSSLFFVVESA